MPGARKQGLPINGQAARCDSMRTEGEHSWRGGTYTRAPRICRVPLYPPDLAKCRASSHPTMNPDSDLPRLALALEYADLAAALYLAGGSDHAARLLAAAAEQVLGDLAKLLGDRAQSEEVQALLARIALRYRAPLIEPRSHLQSRQSELPLSRDGNSGMLTGLPSADARQATAAYLRAAWYTLEVMGLEAVMPGRLRKAVEHSTICEPMA